MKAAHYIPSGRLAALVQLLARIGIVAVTVAMLASLISV
jgi:hypothetical protein